MELQASYKRFWDHDQIKEQILLEKLSKAQSFTNCYDPKKNLTSAFKTDISRRTRGKIPLSLVVQIFGTQGDGKTKLGFEIGKKISPTFSAEKVFMKAEDLLDYCKKAKKGDCLQLDEQKIQYGEGALRQLADLQNIEEITRILQIHFIYCSPTLRDHLATHYTLQIIQKNTEKRLTKFAFCNNKGTYYYGFGLAFIPKDEDCPIYKTYEPIKLKYVKDVLERSGQKYDIWKKASQLLNHPDLGLARNKNEVLVICQDLWPSLTLGEHNKIVSAGNLLQSREKRKMAN